MRISADKVESVQKIISLGVNKQKMKTDLMSDGKTIVSLKHLHNVQTKLRLRKEANYQGDDLQKLLERLREIPNARIRVVTNEENELIGKRYVPQIYYHFI